MTESETHVLYEEAEGTLPQHTVRLRQVLKDTILSYVAKCVSVCGQVLRETSGSLLPTLSLPKPPLCIFPPSGLMSLASQHHLFLLKFQRRDER